MAAYYNESDKFAAAWLRELIKAKLIADGEVDERSIELVRPDDLRGFVQCHFFAGIGGWSYALRLAGWSDDREVWTGSCPCQPWSSAGAGLEADDPRDLWPTWFQLIRQCGPAVVFGEQVAGKAGRAWLDRVYDDMETDGYAVGPFDLPSCSVGAFDKRQRHWFVADTGHTSGRPNNSSRFDLEGRDRFISQWAEAPSKSGNRGEDCDVADAKIDGLGQGRPNHARRGARIRSQGTGLRPQHNSGGSVADTDGPLAGEGPLQRGGSKLQSHQDATARPWDRVEWLECRDGKARPIEPGLEPLAHGIPARVGRLRGYGNSINPWVAAEVIAAYMEICQERPDGSETPV